MLKKDQKNLVYLLVLILPFVLFFTQPNIFYQSKSGLVRLISVPIGLISVPLKELKKILYYHRIFDEYKRLKEEVAVLKSRLVGFEELIRENSRLQKLLDFKSRLVYSSVVANVIGRDPSYWNSTMIIDKGETDGIKQGMPVVNALGVIGKIADVGKTRSKVILLVDPQFSVAAVIQGSRENGLISGSLQGVCRMRYLDPTGAVHLGDKVVTSKLSSSFPENLQIGEVISVDQNSQKSSLECLVRPAVSLSEIEEVLVILK